MNRVKNRVSGISRRPINAHMHFSINQARRSAVKKVKYVLSFFVLSFESLEWPK
jgi:hypothetical protein